LVNNDSDTWQELLDATRAAGYDVTPVHHSAISSIDPYDYDLAILSGGWYYDDEEKMLREYNAELELIKSAPVPILGICVGMQLMHIADDESVPLLGKRQYGWAVIDVLEAGRKLFGFSERIKVFKNHDRAVIETDPDFEILATSPGFTEIMLHKSKSLLGVQFHPEVGTTEQSVEMLETLVEGLLRVTKERGLKYHEASHRDYARQVE